MSTVQIGDMQAALGFVLSQRSHIETEVLKRPYPAIRYAQFVPVDTSANPFAASVTFFSQDAQGKAKMINGKGDDIPLVNMQRQKFETTVGMGGIGYSFSLEEIGAAQMVGQSLSADGAEAARMGYEQFVDDVAMVGANGNDGLLTMAGVTEVAAGKTLAAMTPDEILALVNDNIAAIEAASLGVELVDTVIFPLASAGKFEQRLGDGSDTTILDFIMRANRYTRRTGQPLMIEFDHRLTNKATMYRRDPAVVKLSMPMPLQFIAPQAVNLEIKVLGMFRFAPVNIRRPQAFRRITGLAA